MTGPEHFRWAQTNFDWTPERVERLKKLWAAGKSGLEIADELGCSSRSAVIGKVHRLKLPVREKGRDRENRRQTSKLFAKHNTPRAQRYGEGLAAHIAPQAAKRLAPLPMPPPEAPTASAVKFEALEPHHCRWPYGHGKERVFCGCETTAGTSWCASHHARVFKPIDLEAGRRRHHPQREKTFDDIERENA